MKGVGMTRQQRRPFLSLIIATCGRSAELQRCLAALSSCDGQVEVIVMDQNEDDRVADLLSSASGELRVTHLRVSRRCASLARNLGAAHAQGAWVGFPDDDCWYRPDTLPRVLERILRKEADLISGVLLAPGGEPAILRWLSAECVITPGRVRRTTTECTVFLRREAFLSVGGFDLAFGPGSQFAAEEGVDLLRRLQRDRRDVRMVFCPEIRIHHEQSTAYQTEAALQKTVAYSHARGACGARHRRLASLPRVAVELCKTLVGCLVLQGLRRECRIRSLTALGRGFCEYLRWNAHISGEPCTSTATRSKRSLC